MTKHPQFLLCPVGLIGSGKTTVTTLLAEKLDAVRISTDEMREKFHKQGIGYEKVADALVTAVREHLELGLSVAIDADCASASTRELIREAERKLGIKVIWVHIVAPEEVIIERLRHTNKTWLWPTPNDAINNYMQRKPLHEHLDMPFVYTFDTSRDDIKTQVEQAVATIQQGLSYNRHHDTQ